MAHYFLDGCAALGHKSCIISPMCTELIFWAEQTIINAGHVCLCISFCHQCDVACAQALFLPGAKVYNGRFKGGLCLQNMPTRRAGNWLKTERFHFVKTIGHTFGSHDGAAIDVSWPASQHTALNAGFSVANWSEINKPTDARRSISWVNSCGKKPVHN